MHFGSYCSAFAELSIGLTECSTCMCSSSNHFIQILYLFVHRFLEYSIIMSLINSYSKLFYFVRIIRNSTVRWKLMTPLCGYIAPYLGHMGGGKSGLVSTVCACAKTPMISWGIVYHRLLTIDLYRIGPKHVCLKLILHTAGKK